MKSAALRSGARGLFVFLLAAGIQLSGAEKQIRLRHESIRTEAPARLRANNVLNEAPVSGLFLIQFSSRFQPEWRAVFEQHRVTLLRYVPDDSFVARLDNVRLSELYTLPNVQWVGPYRAEYKLDSRLPKNQAAARGVVDETSVRILVTPDANLKTIAQLRRAFRKFDRESSPRFGKILEGSVTFAQLEAFAKSPNILWIEPAPRMKLFDEVATKIVTGDDFIGGTPPLVHDLGFTGAGVSVAVADSGLHMGAGEPMHPDLDGRVDAFFHYGELEDASDEHSHGTHCTGIVAGDGAANEFDENGYLYGLGVAPEAHIVAQRIFDGVGGYHAPPSFEVLTHDAVRAGAEIGSNSWGEDTQGQYDLSAAEFDELVRDADAGTPGAQPYILEFSAGNAGPGEQTIGTPAVAKNVIATGASENNRFNFFIYDSGQETMADFSSRGPCADGRIKPDITAPGTWIASLRSAFANDENAWLDISENYLYQGGTSQAGPAASGAAAVFVQFYRKTVTNATPSPALVKAALINSAIDMDNEFGGTAPVPNNDEGWGRVDLAEIIGASRRFEFTDQTVLLVSSNTFEKRVVIASTNEPLKITLAYTDPPGLPAAIPALVNDLDLEVIAPNGFVFRGNQFDSGESVPNAASFDSINNVEAVHLSAPVPGEYIVRIHGRNIVEDARIETPAIDQDFALVISGEIPMPGVGTIFFDKGNYKAPSLATVKLIDPDLTGQPSVSVVVNSSTEPIGETLVLKAFGNHGVFTGSIATVTGPAVVDGQLQIAHGGAITATYADTAPAGTRTANARGDLVAPVITNVSATNRFGEVIISWRTDELASSAVRLGPNANPSLLVTNAALKTQHSVTFQNLQVGTNYFYLVASTDEAGNAATNNNGGVLFQILVQPAAAVLLVNAYFHDEDFYESVEIPVTAYTDALDLIGVSYEVWDVPTLGSPTLAHLRPYRAVIWRINDSFYDQRSIAPGEQTAIQNYLNSGGAFFMASMEILSRLGNVPFRANVFRVQSFTANPDPFSPCATCDEDHGVPAIYGFDNDQITSGVEMELDYSQYPEIDFIGLGPDLSDTFLPSSAAASILIDDSSGRNVGIRFPKAGQTSTNRVVFFSFPLEAVPVTGADPNNRANLLRNALSFLIPTVGGLGTIALDNSAYTVPSLVTVEVADSDLAGTGQATVNFFSDTATNGQPITIYETVRPGVFLGFITLVSPTNAFQSGELRAQHGDAIWAEYFDASANGITRVVAEVDTDAPLISGRTVLVDYTEATISWNTSKPTDALVQFGESTFLERTGYDPEPDTEHSITITGLQPGKTYYYQITSRDHAGNVTTDNNNGNLYTLQTRQPFLPPWTDNLENTFTNWRVSDTEGSEVSWQLGRPNNGVENQANSGTNAWGSNLNNQNVFYTETSLLSPAVTLTGGNSAKLYFWHSIEFPDAGLDIEIPGIMISTNFGHSWTDLAQITEATDGWEEMKVNLTPYLGQTIRLGFYYGLVAIESSHSGWLLDDFAIEVKDIGNILVTNNLAQAHFELDGPDFLQGEGWETFFPEAAEGAYVITFSPVPFYLTPARQTNTLAAPATLIFQGNYTFPDANTNGISDLWEQHFFGGVSTNRTALTDSDGDGMTDYAEFMAGTVPTNLNSSLKLSSILTNQTLEVKWKASIDRAYQLQSSASLTNWTAASDWMIATNTNASFSLPWLTNSTPSLIRLQVKP